MLGRRREYFTQTHFSFGNYKKTLSVGVGSSHCLYARRDGMACTLDLPPGLREFTVRATLRRE